MTSADIATAAIICVLILAVEYAGWLAVGPAGPWLVAAYVLTWDHVST